MEGADGHAVGELIDRAHSLLDAYGSGESPAHVATAVELLRPLLDQESPPVVVLLSLAHATLLRAALPPEHGGPDARHVLGEVESALDTVAGAARRIGSHAFVTWGRPCGPRPRTVCGPGTPTVPSKRPGPRS
ncbi:hypothetical protein ACQ86F_36855 [Streptomyces venezuelae ATCC 10712]